MKEEKSLCILLIEDDSGDAELINEMLKGSEKISFEFNWAENLASAVEFMTKNMPDIILSDLNLPDSTGLDTFAKIYERANAIPIILLTGLVDEETAVTALRKGAQDYLIKGSIDRILLTRSILYSLERKKLLTELENNLREIKTLKGMIPICAWCRKLRDDDGYWKQVEAYIQKHTNAKFTHGICPECEKKTWEEYENSKKKHD